MHETAPATKTVAVIGGGFSGSLFALKLSRARPDIRVLLIERNGRHGTGLAYGAAEPYHLLNVPVQRMEVGLQPSFTAWLSTRHDVLADALAESGQDLSAAFVPRELFGAYLRDCIAAANAPESTRGLGTIRGEVVRLLDSPSRGLLLDDGREFAADQIVLATGNLPPQVPPVADAWLYDTGAFIPDPWARGAYDHVDRDAAIMILGTGLTMVDIALKLVAEGHRGPIHAISRRGLSPLAHKGGGAWEPFIAGLLPATPRQLMRAIRDQTDKAAAAGIPWQRVIDAVRPNIAGAWDSWTVAERRQFLRHIRPRWDVHRHRLAPRIADKLAQLIAGGQLDVRAGRIRNYRASGGQVEISLAPRGKQGEIRLRVAAIINCTGPRSDLDRIGIPLIADLRRRGLIVPDPLRLGIETQDCAVVDTIGRRSDWLYALGPLTRPAWWEVTAVPEIAVQVDQLANDLAVERQASRAETTLHHAFADLGAGI